MKAVTARSRALWIVRDLHNLEKHPDVQPNTSDDSPKLQNVKRVMRATGIQISLHGVVINNSSLQIHGEVINAKTGSSSPISSRSLATQYETGRSFSGITSSREMISAPRNWLGAWRNEGDRRNLLR